MKKSVYARPSGRTAEEHSTATSKSAHLTSTRDPFKPRRSDLLASFLVPMSVFSYTWKRAALPLSVLHSFSRVYILTGLTYVLCMMPYCMINNQAEHEGASLDHRDSYFNALYAKWPWYRTVSWLFLLPYSLMVAMSLKAWWRARRITKLAIERAEERSNVVATSFDVDRQLFSVPETLPGAAFINDLLSLKMKADEIDVQQAIQPPSVLDVGGVEEFEENVSMSLPPLAACWFGPMRPVCMTMGFLIGVVFHTLTELAVLLLGWPLSFLYLWGPGKSVTLGDATAFYKPVFLGGLWNLGYAGGATALLVGCTFVCYKFSKQTGVLVQLNRVA